MSKNPVGPTHQGQLNNQIKTFRFQKTKRTALFTPAKQQHIVNHGVAVTPGEQNLQDNRLRFQPQIEQLKTKFLQKISLINWQSLSAKEAKEISTMRRMAEIFTSEDSAIYLQEMINGLGKYEEAKLAPEVTDRTTSFLKPDPNLDAAKTFEQRKLTRAARDQDVGKARRMISEVELVINDLLNPNISHATKIDLLKLFEAYTEGGKSEVIVDEIKQTSGGSLKGDFDNYKKYYGSSGVPAFKSQLEKLIAEQGQIQGFKHNLEVQKLSVLLSDCRSRKDDNIPARHPLDKEIDALNNSNDPLNEEQQRKLNSLISTKEKEIERLKAQNLARDFTGAMRNVVVPEEIRKEFQRDLQEIENQETRVDAISGMSRLMLKLFSPEKKVGDVFKELQKNPAILDAIGFNPALLEYNGLRERVEIAFSHDRIAEVEEDFQAKIDDFRIKFTGFRHKFESHQVFLSAISRAPISDRNSAYAQLGNNFDTLAEDAVDKYVVQIGPKLEAPNVLESGINIPSTSTKDLEKAKLLYEKIVDALNGKENTATKTTVAEQNEMAEVELYSLYKKFFSEVRDYFSDDRNYKDNPIGSLTHAKFGAYIQNLLSEKDGLNYFLGQDEKIGAANKQTLSLDDTRNRVSSTQNAISEMTGKPKEAAPQRPPMLAGMGSLLDQIKGGSAKPKNFLDQIKGASVPEAARPAMGNMFAQINAGVGLKKTAAPIHQSPAGKPILTIRKPKTALEEIKQAQTDQIVSFMEVVRNAKEEFREDEINAENLAEIVAMRLRKERSDIEHEISQNKTDIISRLLSESRQLAVGAKKNTSKKAQLNKFQYLQQQINDNPDGLPELDGTEGELPLWYADYLQKQMLLIAKREGVAEEGQNLLQQISTHDEEWRRTVAESERDIGRAEEVNEEILRLRSLQEKYDDQMQKLTEQEEEIRRLREEIQQREEFERLSDMGELLDELHDLEGVQARITTDMEETADHAALMATDLMAKMQRGGSVRTLDISTPHNFISSAMRSAQSQLDFAEEHAESQLRNDPELSRILTPYTTSQVRSRSNSMVLDLHLDQRMPHSNFSSTQQLPPIPEISSSRNSDTNSSVIVDTGSQQEEIVEEIENWEKFSLGKIDFADPVEGIEYDEKDRPTITPEVAEGLGDYFTPLQNNCGTKGYYADFAGFIFDETSRGRNRPGIFNNDKLYMANFRGCTFKDVDFTKIPAKIFSTISFTNCQFEGNYKLPEGFAFKESSLKGVKGIKKGEVEGFEKAADKDAEYTPSISPKVLSGVALSEERTRQPSRTK